MDTISLLVVCDGVDRCAHYRRLFTTQGFVVSTAVGPRDLIHTVTKVKPHITLIDLACFGSDCTDHDALCFQLQFITEQVLFMTDPSSPIILPAEYPNLSILFKPIDDFTLVTSIYKSLLSKFIAKISEYDARILPLVDCAVALRQEITSPRIPSIDPVNPYNHKSNGLLLEPNSLQKQTESQNKSPTSKLPELTKRQREILLLIASGHTNREIGEKLFLSNRTVEAHRRRLMDTLGVKGVSNLIRLAVEYGLIPYVFNR